MLMAFIVIEAGIKLFHGKVTFENIAPNSNISRPIKIKIIIIIMSPILCILLEYVTL